MRQELQERFRENFGHMLPPVNENGPNYSINLFGLEIGEGWYHLVHELCDEIDFQIHHNKRSPICITTIKEKYGSLNVYHDGGDDFIKGLVTAYENMSYHVCERCGTNKDVCTTKGWISQLCEKCIEEHENDVVRDRDYVKQQCDPIELMTWRQREEKMREDVSELPTHAKAMRWASGFNGRAT